MIRFYTQIEALNYFSHTFDTSEQRKTEILHVCLFSYYLKWQIQHFCLLKDTCQKLVLVPSFKQILFLTDENSKKYVRIHCEQMFLLFIENVKKVNDDKFC